MNTGGGEWFAALVRARLSELGENAYAVERRHQLPADAIRNVIRDDEKRSIPSVARAKQICDALGIELSVAPRHDGTHTHDGSITYGAPIPPEEASLADLIAEASRRDRRQKRLRLAERLAREAGLEFYLGPPRSGFAEGQAPYTLSDTGADGWGTPDRPPPQDGPFYIRADDPALPDWLMVEPGAPLAPGALVYAETPEGRAAVGRHGGAGSLPGSVAILHHGLRDERVVAALRRLAPVTWTGSTAPPGTEALARCQARAARLEAALRAISDTAAGSLDPAHPD
jgi:hypothetical protein